MTEYDDDLGKLQRAKQDISRLFRGQEFLEPDCPDGMLFGPRTKEQLDQVLKDLAEQNDDLEEEDDA